MSRIAKQPINIPEKVSFEDDKNVWFVSGPNGKLSLKKIALLKSKILIIALLLKLLMIRKFLML